MADRNNGKGELEAPSAAMSAPIETSDEAKPLTALVERFCQEYVNDLDGTAAYNRARGRDVRSAGQRAYELLQRQDVRQHIAELQAEISERNKVTQDEVVGVLRENIQRGLQREPVRDSKGVPTGEWKWEGGVVNKAAELLGRSIGMFEVHSPSSNLTIIVDLDKFLPGAAAAAASSTYLADLDRLVPPHLRQLRP